MCDTVDDDGFYVVQTLPTATSVEGGHAKPVAATRQQIALDFFRGGDHGYSSFDLAQMEQAEGRVTVTGGIQSSLSSSSEIPYGSL